MRCSPHTSRFSPPKLQRRSLFTSTDIPLAYPFLGVARHATICRSRGLGNTTISLAGRENERYNLRPTWRFESP